MVKIRGRFEITLRDKHGNIESREVIDNVITDAGLEYITKLIIGEESDHFTHLQIAGDTEIDVLNTGFSDMLFEAEANLSYVADNIARFTFVFNTFSEETTVTSAGIFNGESASSPTMLGGQVFTPRVVSMGGTLDVKYDIIIGR